MQPDFYLGTLRLAEPVIALTGLFIAFVCGYAWVRLRRREVRCAAFRWMIWFFGLMAISSVIGPFFGHMFYYQVGFPGKFFCWLFSILSLAALAQASIEHARPFLPAKASQALTVANLSFLVLGLGLSGWNRSFHWVEAHSAIAMLGFMMPLEGLVYARRRDPGSLLLLLSLPIAVLAIVPVLIKWSPGTWFSYFDVGHVILYGCFWLMMLGAERRETAATL
ncbi:MAG: hypothetical protein IT260_02825 [Saprospiraceae bacterium]|nr:hypothetical protein [Saprospiraceae bacterium]